MRDFTNVTMNSHSCKYNPEVHTSLTCWSHPVNNFLTTRSGTAMLSSDGVVLSLQNELAWRARIALRFDRRYGMIPHEIRKQNNYEAMKFVEKFCSEQEYIRRARLLGFRRRKSYTVFSRGNAKTVYEQAIDYVECLFNFHEYYFVIILESEDSNTSREEFYEYLVKIVD